MASKTTITLLCAALLLLPGCAGLREAAQPAPPAPSSKVAPDKAREKPRSPMTAGQPRPPTVARSARTATPPPATAPARAELPAMIGHGASWTDPGFSSLVVKRGDPSTLRPVPLFRQANVLASVRAALAASPAQPRAEFTHGTLKLTFDRGSNEEIAAAVKQALAVPEAENIRVSLQP